MPRGVTKSPSAKGHDGPGPVTGGRKSKMKVRPSRAGSQAVVMSKRHRTKSRSASTSQLRDQEGSIGDPNEELEDEGTTDQNEEDPMMMHNLDPKFQKIHRSYMRHQEQAAGKGRYMTRNLWDVCCRDIEQEVRELGVIMKKLGLPPVNYSKMKNYELVDYDFAPDLKTCTTKDFLDFYVFPYLLPAIEALIHFARVNRIFQCRLSPFTFNALDYIVEYLYNNNPRYPERLANPTPIFEIPFCKAWLEKNPRPPQPKWMLMTSDEAAVIIQRAIRGWLVRLKPEVQELRQFWKEIRQELAEKRMIEAYGRHLSEEFHPSTLPLPPLSSNYAELYGEGEEEEDTGAYPQHVPQPVSPIVSCHSDNCVYCSAFRKFIESQPEEIIRSYERKPSKKSLGRLSIGSNLQKTTSRGNASGLGDGEVVPDSANLDDPTATPTQAPKSKVGSPDETKTVKEKKEKKKKKQEG